jgi:hypothetical protein
MKYSNYVKSCLCKLRVIIVCVNGTTNYHELYIRGMTSFGNKGFSWSNQVDHALASLGTNYKRNSNLDETQMILFQTVGPPLIISRFVYRRFGDKSNIKNTYVRFYLFEYLTKSVAVQFICTIEVLDVGMNSSNEQIFATF